MALVVYTLCFLTAAGCAVVLLGAYRRSRAPLLFWSGVCFVGLALNEAMVLVDTFVISDTSFFVVRNAIGLAALCVMLGSLILDEGADR